MLNATLYIKNKSNKSPVMTVKFIKKGTSKMVIAFDDFTNPNQVITTEKAVKLVDVTGDSRAARMSPFDNFGTFLRGIGLTVGSKTYRNMDSLKADFHVESKFH